jgi:hypothetical protein
MRVLVLSLTVLTVLGIAGVANAQIPNAGFENWVSGEPVGWVTPNSPGFDTLVTPSGDRHGGALAMRGEVKSLFGFPFAPTVITGQDTVSGFPVTQRHASLTGWYKFAPVQDDQMIAWVWMYTATGDSGIGFGGQLLGPASTFTLFTLPITYATGNVPGMCVIEFSVVGGDTVSGLPHPGSSFIVDDLAFSGVSSAGDAGAFTPQAFSLMQNYPNPFNGETRIGYRVQGLGAGELVTLKVYDMLGREVATLVNERTPPGEYSVGFDAGKLSSGVYMYRLQAGNAVETRRMMLVR